MDSQSPRIEVLGSFRVSSGGRLIQLSHAGEHVLALLALARGPLTRERVAGTLWPDVDRGLSQARLRSTLWRLGSERSLILETRGNALMLPQVSQVDLYDAERLGQALVSAIPTGFEAEKLLTLFGQDLLSDWYEPWLDIEREIYRETRVHALESLARALIAKGQYFLAIRACMEAIRCEPYRDTSHLLLVEAYRAEGNPGAAMSHILRYKETLWDELRVAPGRILKNLEAELVT